MCLSCGCGKPQEDHGNPANITLRDLEAAAKAGGVDPGQAAKNIQKTYNEKVAAVRR
jgi:hypothetical protein